ncbi:hypothetical protein ACLKA7_012497 [Drosophila subpalustris]
MQKKTRIFKSIEQRSARPYLDRIGNFRGDCAAAHQQSSVKHIELNCGQAFALAKSVFNESVSCLDHCVLRSKEHMDSRNRN